MVKSRKNTARNMIQDSDYGLVYLLTNSAMPGIVKIGMTTRGNLEVRLKELYGTGVPVPFECAFACKVKKEDAAKLEHALHVAFAPYRVNPKREFFEIDPAQAIAIMSYCNEGDITGEVSQEIDNELSEAEKESKENFRQKRPSLNYQLMGIPEGAVLTYSKDNSITATVVLPNKVCFRGETLSLTAATRKIMGLPENAAIQPTPYWMIGSENLLERYNKTFPIGD